MPLYHHKSLQTEHTTGKTGPCFRYEGKIGKERNLVIFKDIPMNNHINGELSNRAFH